MRELSDDERRNVGFLTENDIPYGVLELTGTGLAKSILDATATFRGFLQAAAVHDYERQLQGPDWKVRVPSVLVLPNGQTLDSSASLYRPLTKLGDPRVWFSGLKHAASAGDVIAVAWVSSRFVVFDTRQVEMESLVNSPGLLRDLFNPYIRKKGDAVGRLLDLLRGVSDKGFMPAPVRGPTAVGRLLETQLGIEINSRRDPDFEGIEIKSSRNARNRTTLFAKTPDWRASRFKSSRELLAEFGYDREGRRKLSCTISGIVTNSQGLALQVDERSDRLDVIYGEPLKSAVTWELESLRYSLAAKHNETFWVKAETKVVDGWEYIRFVDVQHTQKPIVEQLPPLLSEGKVTVDFLIRETGDKGYLFKLLPKNLPLLFPPAKSYALAASDRITGLPPVAPPLLF